MDYLITLLNNTVNFVLPFSCSTSMQEVNKVLRTSAREHLTCSPFKSDKLTNLQHPPASRGWLKPLLAGSQSLRHRVGSCINAVINLTVSINFWKGWAVSEQQKLGNINKLQVMTSPGTVNYKTTVLQYRSNPYSFCVLCSFFFFLWFLPAC